MALSYEIRGGILRYTAHGDVEYDVGLRVLQDGLAAAVAAYDGTPIPVLFDIRDSAEHRGADELRGIAAVLGQHAETVGGKCAIAAESGLYYGVSRMFAVFVEEYGIEMQIFETPEKAEAWLLPES